MERRTFIKVAAATTLLGTIPLSVQAKVKVKVKVKARGQLPWLDYYQGFDIKRSLMLPDLKPTRLGHGSYVAEDVNIPIGDFKRRMCIEDVSRLVDATLSEAGNFGINNKKQIWIVSTENPNIWGLHIPPVAQEDRWSLKIHEPGIRVYEKGRDRKLFSTISANGKGKWYDFPVNYNVTD